jgi:hypothetical protein
MVDQAGRVSSLLAFLLLAYGILWVFFGLGRLLGIPLSMDVGTLGGVFYLIGAAVPSLSALAAVFVFERRQGLAALLKRSLAWRFSPLW